jgi:hypothetical protein
MKRAFFLDTGDKPGLLVSLMRFFAGSAHIALEGNQDDMSGMNFETIPGFKEGLVGPFDSEWSSDRNRFIVLPLETETIPLIMSEILPEGRVIHKVGAIQIEKNGEIQFLAGHHFYRECASVGPGAPEQLLKSLVASGILRAYYSTQDGTEEIIRKMSGR